MALPKIFASLTILVLLLCACGRSGRSDNPISTATPSATTPSATTPPSSVTSGHNVVYWVDVSRCVDLHVTYDRPDRSGQTMIEARACPGDGAVRTFRAGRNQRLDFFVSNRDDADSLLSCKILFNEKVVAQEQSAGSRASCTGYAR
jgi:hypothetical protein